MLASALSRQDAAAAAPFRRFCKKNSRLSVQDQYLLKIDRNGFILSHAPSKIYAKSDSLQFTFHPLNMLQNSSNPTDTSRLEKHFINMRNETCFLYGSTCKSKCSHTRVTKGRQVSEGVGH